MSFVKFDEQVVSFLVANNETSGIAVDDSWVDEVIGRVAHAFEVTGNRNELLHLAVVLGTDLLKRRSKLKLLLSGNENEIM